MTQPKRKSNQQRQSPRPERTSPINSSLLKRSTRGTHKNTSPAVNLRTTPRGEMRAGLLSAGCNALPGIALLTLLLSTHFAQVVCTPLSWPSQRVPAASAWSVEFGFVEVLRALFLLFTQFSRPSQAAKSFLPFALVTFQPPRAGSAGARILAPELSRLVELV